MTLAGQNHRANAGDADSDGIPDDLDPWPNDPTNNSYWWAGGWFTISNTSTYFPPQYMAGWGQDSDGDGIPDAVDPYPSDPNNGNNTGGTGGDDGTGYTGGNNGDNGNWWPGGTFLVNGQYCTYAGQWYTGSSADSDGDGIPDALDPWPNDPWNNTYFTWGGGWFMVDAQWAYFPGGTYGGLWQDSDGDGIPDVADPYPSDASNNTAWWLGGTRQIDRRLDLLPRPVAPGRCRGCQDADGIPDDLDPEPTDWPEYQWWLLCGLAAAHTVARPEQRDWLRLPSGRLHLRAVRLPRRGLCGRGQPPPAPARRRRWLRVRPRQLPRRELLGREQPGPQLRQDWRQRRVYLRPKRLPRRLVRARATGRLHLPKGPPGVPVVGGAVAPARAVRARLFLPGTGNQALAAARCAA